MLNLNQFMVRRRRRCQTYIGLTTARQTPQIARVYYCSSTFIVPDVGVSSEIWGQRDRVTIIGCASCETWRSPIVGFLAMSDLSCRHMTTIMLLLQWVAVFVDDTFSTLHRNCCRGLRRNVDYLSDYSSFSLLEILRCCHDYLLLCRI